MSATLDLIPRLLATAPPENGPSTEGVWGLFSIMTILLVFLLLGLAVITLLRMLRRRSPTRKPLDPTPHVDAWAEAGRRATSGDEPRRKK